MTFEGFPGAGAEPEVSYDRLASDGFYSRKPTDPASSAELEIPLPVVIGRKWSGDHDGIPVEMELVAIEDLDVAEKTYQRCLKVVSNGVKGGQRVRAVSYYAPRIGLVKTSLSQGAADIEMTIRSE